LKKHFVLIFLLISISTLGQGSDTTAILDDPNRATKDSLNQKLFNYLNGLKGGMLLTNQLLERILTCYEKQLESEIGSSHLFEFLSQRIEALISNQIKLEDEIRQVQKNTNHPELATALGHAAQKLRANDHSGFLGVLQSYKTQIMNGGEIAKITYLQALDNYNNYYFEEALRQTDSALVYDGNNVNYQLLKARILFSLARNDESIGYYLKAAKDLKDDTLKVDVYNGIGLVYMEMEEYDNAIGYFYQALGTATHTRHYISPRTGVSYDGLGMAYFEKEDYDSALYYFRKDSIIGANADRQEQNHLGSTYNNIGMVFYQSGDYTKALEYYNKSLQLDIRQFGRDAPDVGISYNNLGMLYKKRKKYAQALSYFRKDSALENNIFGEDHPAMCTSYDNIGMVYYDMKDYDRALAYQYKALKIWENSPWEHHRSIASAYGKISMAYYEKDDFGNALSNKSNQLWEEMSVPRKNDSALRDLEYNIGALYLVTGDTINGINYLNKSSYPISDKAGLLNETALDLFARQKYLESIRLFLPALAFLAKADPAQGDVLWPLILNNLAKAYCRSGNSNRALPLFERAISLASKIKEANSYLDRMKKNYQECKTQ
jgi:tetratricopeptide (TPR) repeat protein